MDAVFSEDACLQMQVRTEAISFPQSTVGQKAITQVLVKDFNQTYENIYTFCLEDTVIIENNTLQCRWLVYMNDITSGLSRVGFGNYQWEFAESNLVTHLKIMIDDMAILPVDNKLLSWVEGMPYPWASSTDMLGSLPEIDALNHLHNKLVC